ncbi:hypothetical protein DFH07DRAFT_767164 [Mycena maculata]|uniref:Uncharacterized protein n=1 Tax=Mycena maculata TaxID=230809 RepID=A0AAD7NUP1_9AGAR|nr:hypothetical protein DFH07DRAFT_767164 [Mycena maculata]
MRLHLIIYALISILYVGALPTDRNDKRSDPPPDTRTPYEKCLDNGKKILKAIADSPGDTADLTIDYNKLYHPFTVPSKLDTASGDGKTIQKLVGITLSPELDVMKVGRSLPKSDRDIAYQNYFDAKNGLIVGAYNFNKRFFDIPGESPPGSDLPPMTPQTSLHWSQFVGEQYKSSQGSLAKLRYILRLDIENTVTHEIIDRAVSASPPLPVQGEWTVVDRTGQTELFTALLGTDNGQGAGYMLKDYKSTMRGKEIQAIRVQNHRSTYHMIIDYSSS